VKIDLFFLEDLTFVFLNLEQLKDKIQIIIEGLLDLISKYKAKRNLWEVKLKKNDDPRRADFYAIIARLCMLDMMVADLDHFIQPFMLILQFEKKTIQVKKEKTAIFNTLYS
jgi:hypothetical protein